MSIRRISQLGETKPDDKKPEASKPKKEGDGSWKKTLGKIIGLAVIIFLLYLFYKNWSEERDARLAREARARVEYCKGSPLSRGCFPADSTFTAKLSRGDTLTVPVPPYYYADWWISCGEVARTEREDRASGVDYHSFSLKPGQDSAFVRVEVYSKKRSSDWQAFDKCA